jgi:peptide/nickel transport system substrate-binding protein
LDWQVDPNLEVPSVVRCHRSWRTALAAVALAILASGCGSHDHSSAATAHGTATPAAGTFASPAEGRRGGHLIVLNNGDVDSLDPGVTYYGPGWQILYATNRTLYSFKAGPIAHGQPEPDIASGPPQISSDARTITVKLRSDVRFSPPVNRAVTSADVKYAIERAFTKQVVNGYAGAYFTSIHGAPAPGSGGYKPISGLETPDPQTLVIKLDRPEAATVSAALVLPITVPVPKAYAQPFDAHNPSTYDRHVVFTGPYQVPHDATGKLTGHQPGQRLELTRNPNWSAATDYRPAYLDAITIEEGNSDTSVATQRVLNGQSLATGDFVPPPSQLAKLSRAHSSELQLVPSGGTRYIALNTTVPPLDNLNVRRAILAVFDRNAMRLTFGGSIAGPIATGFLPPGLPGFDEAGGLRQGSGFDFLRSPTGNLTLAQSYMRKAGYASGKYTGGASLLMVTDNTSADPLGAQVVQAQLAKIGLKTTIRTTTPQLVYTKFCGVPAAKVAICPTMQWSKDYYDGQSLLQPTFDGTRIQPSGNSNYPQLNDPGINAAIAHAVPLPPGSGRDTAWAQVDKQIIAQAPAIPWLWDTFPMVASKNVQGVANAYYLRWDLSFTSLR